MMQNQNELLLDLPFVNEKTQQVTMHIKTNSVDEISVPVDAKIIGRFLLEPDDFEFLPSSLGTVETEQKLCKDPLSGQLYLCSTVTKEQLDYELNACSFEPIHAQTHLEKMLLNLLAQSISISKNHQQLDRENGHVIFDLN